jgi:hypothetical protein
MTETTPRDSQRRSSRRRKLQPMKRGPTRAVVLLVSWTMGVAGFSGLRPMTSKAHVFLTTNQRSLPCNAVPPSLSTERLDTRPQQQGIQPGSPLDMICRDQHEFELSVGHAMDTLRSDYPHILTHKPGTFFL